MKKVILAAIVAISVTPFFSNAQNTFPTPNGNVGIGTTNATHALTIAAGSTGATLYNTTDQTTNYERATQYWSGNIFHITSEANGTGTIRPLYIGDPYGRGININVIDATPMVRTTSGILTDPNARIYQIDGTTNASSGNPYGLGILYDANQSGTAGYRSLFISTYEQSTGSGNKFLMDVGVNSGAGASGTHTSRMVLTSAGKLGIGTSTPDEPLSVNGTIHSKEVKVNTTGLPDYVFKPDYKLPTLAELKTYIDKNSHLPEMPSAQEVEKNGLSLGEMNKLLLKKVEELTLYLIDQKQEIDKLKSEVKILNDK